jgi:hypothetical protein
VSGGVAKARAIAAALRGGFCNCLVTDAHAARAALESHREWSTHRSGRLDLEDQRTRRGPFTEDVEKPAAD